MGRGKKQKGKSKTKVRQDYVYATVNVGEDRVLTMHFDRITDQIEIEGADAGSTRTERSYARENGKPKIVTSIPSNGKSAFAAKDALFAYDSILAVDTNTRTLFGKKCGVCVSYFVPGSPASLAATKQVPYVVLAAYLIVGIGEGVNPERIGWHLTVSRHISPATPANHRIALVVDSELGLHREINSRTIGYYRDHLLPPPITIGYSSSDTDNETLGGGMIRLCDQMATKYLDAIPEISQFPSSFVAGNDDFEKAYSLGVRRSGSA